MKTTTTTTNIATANPYKPNWSLVHSSEAYRRSLIQGLIEALAERDVEIANLLNLISPPPTGDPVFVPGYDGDD
jgi:hypothetical protein